MELLVGEIYHIKGYKDPLCLAISEETLIVKLPTRKEPTYLNRSDYDFIHLGNATHLDLMHSWRITSSQFDDLVGPITRTIYRQRADKQPVRLLRLPPVQGDILDHATPGQPDAGYKNSRRKRSQKKNTPKRKIAKTSLKKKKLTPAPDSHPVADNDPFAPGSNTKKKRKTSFLKPPVMADDPLAASTQRAQFGHENAILSDIRKGVLLIEIAASFQLNVKAVLDLAKKHGYIEILRTLNKGEHFRKLAIRVGLPRQAVQQIGNSDLKNYIRRNNPDTSQVCEFCGNHQKVSQMQVADQWTHVCADCTRITGLGGQAIRRPYSYNDEPMHRLPVAKSRRRMNHEPQSTTLQYDYGHRKNPDDQLRKLEQQCKLDPNDEELRTRFFGMLLRSGAHHAPFNSVLHAYEAPLIQSIVASEVPAGSDARNAAVWWDRNFPLEKHCPYGPKKEGDPSHRIDDYDSTGFARNPYVWDPVNIKIVGEKPLNTLIELVIKVTVLDAQDNIVDVIKIEDDVIYDDLTAMMEDIKARIQPLRLPGGSFELSVIQKRRPT